MIHSVPVSLAQRLCLNLLLKQQAEPSYLSLEPSELCSWKRPGHWNKQSESLQSSCFSHSLLLLSTSPHAAPGSLPPEVACILMAWVLPCFRQEAQDTEPERYAPSLLTSPGSLHLSSSSSSRQKWPPILPTQSPWPVWEQRGAPRRGYCSKGWRSRGGRLPGWNAQLEALGGRRPGVTVILWVRHPGELSALKGLLWHTRQRGTENLPGGKFWKLQNWGTWWYGCIRVYSKWWRCDVNAGGNTPLQRNANAYIW